MELRVITLNQTNKKIKKAQIETYTLTTTTTNKILKFYKFFNRENKTRFKYRRMVFVKIIKNN